MYEFFSKVGYHKRQVEWLPILVARVFLGVFFILSGFFKIFDSSQHEKLLRTLKHANIPMPEFNAYFVPIVELVCGALILIGLITTLASLVLFLVMITALVTDRVASLAVHGGIVVLENFLYLPEVLYALMFFWLFFSGPGKISLDYAYGKKKRLSGYHH